MIHHVQMISIKIINYVRQNDTSQYDMSCPNDIIQNDTCQNDTSQDDTCPNDISQNDTCQNDTTQ